MEIWDDLIVRALRGSITYGTNLTPEVARAHNLPESDRDEVGICIPPKKYVIGLDSFESHLEGEYTIYSLKRFMHLACECNPNVLEVLFLEDRHYLYRTPIFETLKENRKLFLSKLAKHRYSGYAHSQFEKMKVKRENGTGRQDLVGRFGYDVKFFMHAIRLLRQGIEILSEEDVHVFRTQDAQELLDIRLGKLSWEEACALFEYESHRLDEVFEVSTLRNSPDRDSLSKLCVRLHEDFFYAR
jgi:predicted nucleotidyltransferase